jgi:hypothetical protein
MTIWQSWCNQSFGLLPQWVTPRHPNPTRDNGLLVVIRGDLCSKYVHCIHHHYVNGNRNHPVMQLAVLDHGDDGIEAIMVDWIKLPPGDLCQAFETEEEKKLNGKLMTTLCDQAQYP